MNTTAPRKQFKGCLKLNFVEHSNDDVKVKLTAYNDWQSKYRQIIKKQRIYHVNVYVKLANDQTLLVTSQVLTVIDHVQVAEFLKLAWRQATADLDQPIKLFNSYLTLSA